MDNGTAAPPLWRQASANFAALSDQKPEVEAMISQGEAIAVLFREAGVFGPEQREYRARAVQWFRFANGKIARLDEIVAMSMGPAAS